MLSEALEILAGGRADPAPSIRIGIQQEGAGLERGKPPLVVQPVRAFRRSLTGRAAAALVDPYTVSQVPAKKHVYGYVCGLAADIPQRVFDPGNGGQAGTPGGKAELLMGLHHQVFDAAGVLAHEPRGDIVHDGLDGEVGSDGIGFAPSAEALVGFDFDKRPGSVAVGDEKGFNRGDFHGGTSPCAKNSVSCVWFRIELEEFAGRAIQRLAERFDCGQIDPFRPVIENGRDGVGLKARHPGDFRDPVRTVRPSFSHKDMELEFQHGTGRSVDVSTIGRAEFRRPEID